MIEAIIYHPKEGFSKKYAEILGEELGMKTYTIKEGKKSLLNNTEVIFISNIFVNKVGGLGKALKYFSIKYVIGVGMSDYDENDEAIIFANNMKIQENFFYLPGGLDLNNAKGFNKLILKIMFMYYVNIEKEAKKQNKELLPKDKDILNMFKEGYVSKVSKEHLQKFLSQFVM